MSLKFISYFDVDQGSMERFEIKLDLLDLNSLVVIKLGKPKKKKKTWLMAWTFNLPCTITFQFGDYFHKGGTYWCGKLWFEECTIC